MNTFLKTCSSLMKNNPSVAPALERLKKLYIEVDGNPNKVFSLPVLLDKLSLKPNAETFLALRSFEESGLIKKTLRVESPTLGGIADFSSLTDVPDEVEDFRTGMYITVTQDNLKTLYSFSDSDLGVLK